MTEAILIFFALLCSIQLYVHWAIFSKILGHEDTNEKESKGVSVIVAARNEEKNIEHLIESLLNQNHRSFEIIIVNDRSTDSTRAILDKFCDAHKNLKAVHIETLPKGWTGKKHAIKCGIETAQNKILLFTDADCVPKSKDWITQMTSGKRIHKDWVLTLPVRE